MILTILLAIVTFTILFQPTVQRQFAVLVFIVAMWTHELFLSHLEGLDYYGSAALFSLLILILTSGIQPMPRMVVRLHYLCLASILLNALGYSLWSFYHPPNVYDIAFMVFYVVVAIAFLKPDKGDAENVGGDDTILGWRACFRFNQHPGYLYLRKFKSQK